MDASLHLFKTPEGQSRYDAAYDSALRLWPVSYETGFVTTPYGRTHIISCGSPGAPPLVLLHAGQASSTMWFPNVAALAGHFHVLAVDTLGEPGKSIPACRNASRSDAAAWLEGVFDELRISKTCVMGLSRGGWLALNLAHFAPNRLEKIVLLSPAASFIPLNRFFSFVAGAVMRIPARFVAEMALNSWVARGFVVNDVFAEQFITGLQSWDWTVNTTGYSGVMPSVFGDEELAQIRIPILLLIGDQDRLNPPRAIQRAVQLIPHIETEIITQAGHFLSMEQPERVNTRALDFLTGC